MKNRRRRAGQDDLDLDNIEGTDEYQRLEDARRAAGESEVPLAAQGEAGESEMRDEGDVGLWTEDDEEEEAGRPLASAAADTGEEDEGYQARPRSHSRK